MDVNEHSKELKKEYCDVLDNYLDYKFESIRYAATTLQQIRIADALESIALSLKTAVKL